jgi:hypothetical protein
MTLEVTAETVKISKRHGRVTGYVCICRPTPGPGQGREAKMRGQTCRRISSVGGGYARRVRSPDGRLPPDDSIPR